MKPSMNYGEQRKNPRRKDVRKSLCLNGVCYHNELFLAGRYQQWWLLGRIPEFCDLMLQFCKDSPCCVGETPCALQLFSSVHYGIKGLIEGFEEDRNAIFFEDGPSWFRASAIKFVENEQYLNATIVLLAERMMRNWSMIQKGLQDVEEAERTNDKLAPMSEEWAKVRGEHHLFALELLQNDDLVLIEATKTVQCSCFEKKVAHAKARVKYLTDAGILFRPYSCCIQCQTKLNRKSPIKLCADCGQVWYCNRQCQKKHWTEHKEVCKSGFVFNKGSR